METLCKHLRKRIDAHKQKHVTLSVEEIKIRSRFGAENAHSTAWWWDMLSDPTDRIHRALIENDLQCVLDTDSGQVVAVDFYRGAGSN